MSGCWEGSEGDVVVRNGIAAKIFEYKWCNRINRKMRRMRDDQIRILKSLHHPNIIKYISHVGSDSLTMEDGGISLYEFDLSVITKLETTSLIKDMLKGLEYCHSQDIIHRDIKPENLLIKEGTLRICDFGAACDVHDDKYDEFFHGTASFNAPEIIFSMKSYGTKVDIWSAGCVIYEIFENEPLFSMDRTEVAGNMIKWFDSSGYTKLHDSYKYRIRSRMVDKLKVKEFIPLLSKMLVLNPSNRITAKQCLSVIEGDNSF